MQVTQDLMDQLWSDPCLQSMITYAAPVGG
jgi:hypothetical protein